jgi:hypothetical protein
VRGVQSVIAAIHHSRPRRRATTSESPTAPPSTRVSSHTVGMLTRKRVNAGSAR